MLGKTGIQYRMTISDLEFFLVEIEREGHGPPLRSLLVRVATDSDLEGWGEAQLPWRASELEARRHAMLPTLAGRSVFDVEALLEIEPLASAPLCCALEMACWDLIGKLAGQPLCHLFGGTYRQRIPVAISLPNMPVDALSRLARELSDQGFHEQIVGSGGRADDDRQTVAAVRNAAGDRLRVRFDARAGYDLETARDLLNAWEDEGLEYVLDPLDSSELAQIASLRRQVAVPLAVRRAVRTPADMLAVVRCGAAPFAVVDLQQVGGLARARQCAAIARAAGLSVSLCGGPSVGIGTAAVLQLAASTPAFAGSNEFDARQLQGDLLSTSYEMLDGMVPVPRAPGLGVEVDRAKIEKHQIL